jgi:hypothetical protein
MIENVIVLMLGFMGFCVALVVGWCFLLLLSHLGVINIEESE